MESTTIPALVERLQALHTQHKTLWTQARAVSVEMRALEDQLADAYATQLWEQHPHWQREAPTTQQRVRRLAARAAERTMRDIEAPAMRLTYRGKGPIELRQDRQADAQPEGGAE
jgi:hypothetical protein